MILTRESINDLKNDRFRIVIIFLLELEDTKS